MTVSASIKFWSHLKQLLNQFFSRFSSSQSHLISALSPWLLASERPHLNSPVNFSTMLSGLCKSRALSSQLTCELFRFSSKLFQIRTLKFEEKLKKLSKFRKKVRLACTKYDIHGIHEKLRNLGAQFLSSFVQSHESYDPWKLLSGSRWENSTPFQL